MRSFGCVDALNLDGGGSSCMLINGKETINHVINIINNDRLLLCYLQDSMI